MTATNSVPTMNYNPNLIKQQHDNFFNFNKNVWNPRSVIFLESIKILLINRC